MACDLLIKGAQILNGTGSPGFSGSVAVQDGKIAAIGDVSGTAARVIDAQGLTLSAGFIDIHNSYGRRRSTVPSLSLYTRDPDDNLLEWMIYQDT
ncbi:MAG: hypothetical protein O7G88_12070 [bacterium]|nr:hypothetical protein [bacterium]